MKSAAPAAQWAWLGRVPFDRAAELQEQIRQDVQSGARPDTLVLCEHDPVITLGRSARREHILASQAELSVRGIAVHDASRGGDVTYHGPGQLVGYPIFRLRKGVVAHLQGMAAAIISVIADFGIKGEWRRDAPGVWVADAKICAFGVHVRHRISIHGFALNVSNDLSPFDAIIPCGLRGSSVASIATLAHEVSEPHALVDKTVAAFARAFEMEFQSADTLSS